VARLLLGIPGKYGCLLRRGRALREHPPEPDEERTSVEEDRNAGLRKAPRTSGPDAARSLRRGAARKPCGGDDGCAVIGWVLAIGGWLGLGLLWWLVSLRLVAARSGASSAERTGTGKPAADSRRISVFKPVAGPLRADELGRLRRCLESFVAELDERSEMLIGISDQDRTNIALLLEPMRAAHPQAQIKLVVHNSRENYPNHKISVMYSLARHASGELWFWSDADMEAPPGTLRRLREDFAVEGADFVTSPYIVRETNRVSDVLDQLFVNLEFYPGAVLLGRLGLISFGFGSGTLFEAARFKRSVDWDYLGASLADDYHLGRLLGAGRLGGGRLATVPGSAGWGPALLHYLRWHKTIRWCRPASYAAQLFVLPSVGTLLSVLCYPLARSRGQYRRRLRCGRGRLPAARLAAAVASSAGRGGVECLARRGLDGLLAAVAHRMAEPEVVVAASGNAARGCGARYQWSARCGLEAAAGGSQAQAPRRASKHSVSASRSRRRGWNMNSCRPSPSKGRTAAISVAFIASIRSRPQSVVLTANGQCLRV
jgi:hypothetical protein